MFQMLLLIFLVSVCSIDVHKPALMLCDATTSYVLRAFPYVGKEEDRLSTWRIYDIIVIGALSKCRSECNF